MSEDSFLIMSVFISITRKRAAQILSTLYSLHLFVGLSRHLPEVRRQGLRTIERVVRVRRLGHGSGQWMRRVLIRTVKEGLALGSVSVPTAAA